MVNTKSRLPAVLFSLLVVLPLYFRGLFFSSDLAVFAAVAMLFVCIAVLSKKSGLAVGTTCDLSLGLLVLFYFIASISAVNVNAAVTEFYKYLFIYLIYLLVKVLLATEEDRRTALYIAVLGITVMSVISLLSATGLVVYPGAYSSSEIEKWLNGTVQYHNAFGALTLAGFFMACSLLTKKIVQPSGIVLAICSYFLMFGLIMSYSRGAWVFAPIVFIIYVLLADKERRLHFFRLAVPAILSVLCVLLPFTQAVDASNTTSSLLCLLIGLAVFAALYLAVSYIFFKTSGMKHFNSAMITIVALCIVLLLAIVFMPSWFTFLPEQLMSRLSGINLGSETVQERFVFYKDAWNVATESIIFGSGGGAWQDLYGKYQSYLYSTTQAHSYVMQILVETGILGLLAWLATIALFIFHAVRARLRKTVPTDILLAAFCGGITLILHSFIDFDLSIPAVTILLWVLIGILCSGQSKSFFTIPKWVAAAFSALLIALSLVLWYSEYNGTSGREALQKDYKEFALEYMTKASAFNPLNANYAAEKAYALAQNGQTEEASQTIAKALSLAPSNINTQQMGVAVYSLLKDYENAFSCVKNTLSLQPLNPDNYISYLASIRNLVGYYIGQDMRAEAKELCQEGISVRQMAEKASEGKQEAVTLPDEIVDDYTSYFNIILQNLGD